MRPAVVQRPLDRAGALDRACGILGERLRGFAAGVYLGDVTLLADG